MRNNHLHLCNFFCLNTGGLTSVYVRSFQTKAGNISKIWKKHNLRPADTEGSGVSPSAQTQRGLGALVGLLAALLSTSARCKPQNPNFMLKFSKVLTLVLETEGSSGSWHFLPVHVFPISRDLDVAPFEQSTTAPSLLQGKPVRTSGPAIS